VPVFVGHSEAVHLETREDFDLDEVRALLAQAPGVRLTAHSEVASPLQDGADDDRVHVSRLRRDLTHPRGLNMWVVADNVRKGAALNAVQIAERVLGPLSGS
jgi:aspartate-semialdehyde dehydrogenase